MTIAEFSLPPVTGRIPMVLDTDTDNEIDDQFALAYALLSPERLDVQAVYAAPFCRSDVSAGEGMERSHAEILRVLDRLDISPEGLVHKGSECWLGSDTAGPVESPAADDLIERARAASPEAPLYVVAIGAPTNVSSALLMAPDITSRIVVVWLGGNPTYWPRAREYNLEQDPGASRVLLDSDVPLVHVPCVNVAEHLRTTRAEMAAYVRPRGRIGAYLFDLYDRHVDDTPGRSKVIWDIGAVAWLIDASWAPSALVHSPVLTSELTWSHDPARHFVREIRSVRRDEIFADLFAKLPAG